MITGRPHTPSSRIPQDGLGIGTAVRDKTWERGASRGLAGGLIAQVKLIRTSFSVQLSREECTVCEVMSSTLPGCMGRGTGAFSGSRESGMVKPFSVDSEPPNLSGGYPG